MFWFLFAGLLWGLSRKPLLIVPFHIEYFWWRLLFWIALATLIVCTLYVMIFAKCRGFERLVEDSNSQCTRFEQQLCRAVLLGVFAASFLVYWASSEVPDTGILGAANAPLHYPLGSGVYHRAGCRELPERSKLIVGWYFRAVGDEEVTDGFAPPEALSKGRIVPCEICKPLSKVVWLYDIDVPDNMGFLELMGKRHGEVLRFRPEPFWLTIAQLALLLVSLSLAVKVLRPTWDAHNELDRKSRDARFARGLL